MSKDKGLLLNIFIWLLLGLALVACENDRDYTAERPVIPANAQTLDLAKNASAVSSVGVVQFSHAIHNTRPEINYDCMICHIHTAVTVSPSWPCAQCHAPGGIAAGLEACSNPEVGEHGQSCITRACFDCHAGLTPPTDLNDCNYCHANLAFFADSAVEGLQFSSATWTGKTDNRGVFEFRDGDTLTFLVGGVTIGTVEVDSNQNIQRFHFATPIDLVPGAVDETNQTVTNIARFLQSLDIDADPSNGITMPDGLANVTRGRPIDFAVDTVAFENDANLLYILAQFGKTLVTEADAQAHLRATLDAKFPPATGTVITGVPNTNFVLQGLTSESSGVTYNYQWYRADDEAGLNETAIAGATTTEYQPVTADVGKYLVFEVTPAAVGGTPDRSDWLGPITDSQTVTYVSTLDFQSQVDQFHIRLPATAEATFDVISYEPDVGGGATPSTPPVPQDFFGNGDNNDFLVTNCYLFQEDASHTLVFERSGNAPYYEWTDTDVNRRAKKNPLVILAGPDALPAGDYLFTIGANLLSQDDALSGFNTGGFSWADTRTGITNQNHYQVIFTFNY